MSSQIFMIIEVLLMIFFFKFVFKKSLNHFENNLMITLAVSDMAFA